MSEKIIQTYLINEGFFVSTIHRESSTDYPIKYYETMAFKWDKDNPKDLGEIVLQEDSGRQRRYAIECHNNICLELYDKAQINTEQQEEK